MVGGAAGGESRLQPRDAGVLCGQVAGGKLLRCYCSAAAAAGPRSPSCSPCRTSAWPPGASPRSSSTTLNRLRSSRLSVSGTVSYLLRDYKNISYFQDWKKGKRTCSFPNYLKPFQTILYIQFFVTFLWVGTKNIFEFQIFFKMTLYKQHQNNN